MIGGLTGNSHTTGPWAEYNMITNKTTGPQNLTRGYITMLCTSDQMLQISYLGDIEVNWIAQSI
jgi:hypothetical protein